MASKMLYSLSRLIFSGRGCVTPDILRGLASHNPDRIPGFQELRVEDQAKIRKAIAQRHVDPADVPETAKEPSIPALPQPSSSQTAPGTSRKRSATLLHPSGSQASAQHFSSSSSTRVIDISDEESTEEANAEETVDELYCIMKTQVVGIQYYHGIVWHIQLSNSNH